MPNCTFSRFYLQCIIVLLVAWVMFPIYAQDTPQEISEPAEWGEVQNGLRIALVPLQENYKIGGDFLFRLILTNVSTEDAESRWDSVSLYGLRIMDYDGNVPPKNKGIFQSFVREPFILKPGEKKILEDIVNLNDWFRISKPGKYTVVYRGNSYVPNSNTLTLNVAEGAVPIAYRTADSLKETIPAKWKISSANDNVIITLGKKDYCASRVFLSFISPTLTIDDMCVIDIWIVENILEITEENGETSHFREYWGKGRDGHVYVAYMELCVLGRWPEFENDIKQVLGIK